MFQLNTQINKTNMRQLLPSSAGIFTPKVYFIFCSGSNKNDYKKRLCKLRKCE